MAKSFLDRMFRAYKFGPVKDPENKMKTAELRPLHKPAHSKVMQGIKFSPELEELYKFYLQDTFDTRQSFQMRMDRYADLEYAFYNNAIVSMAVELYTDESVQSDGQNQYLKVHAPDAKVERSINELFDNLGITQSKTRATAFDLALYSDSFWIASIDPERGVTSVTPLDVRSITNRLEFDAIAVKKQKHQNQRSFMSNNQILTKLYAELDQNKSDSASFFRKYLFGFQIEDDIVLPPWNVIHFRRFATHSEFAPFGRPLLINAISPFRQLQASKNLMALARASNFPIRHFKVKTSEQMSAAEMWDAVSEAQEGYRNMGKNFTFKETFSVDAEIWSPQDLLELEIKDTRLDLSAIADVEMLEDNLIVSTKIPKGYLISDKGAFGLSGQSLLQQSKIFGRSVYTIQTAILEGLTDLVRLHFAISGEHPADADFELSMNFPVVEQTAEQLRQKTDSLALATDTMDKLAQLLGVQITDIPVEVVRDILNSISFLTGEEANRWIMSIYKVRKEREDNGEQPQPGAPAPGGVPGMDMGGGLGGGLGGGGGMAMGGGMPDMGMAPTGGEQPLGVGGIEGFDSNQTGQEGMAGTQPQASGGPENEEMNAGQQTGGPMIQRNSAGVSAARLAEQVEYYVHDQMRRQSQKKKKKILEKIGPRLTEQAIKLAEFTAKKKNRMHEAILKGRHTYMSCSPSSMNYYIEQLERAKAGGKLIEALATRAPEATEALSLND